MKLEKVINSGEALLELSNKELSISTSIKIKKVLKEYDEIKALYQKKVNDLYTSLGKELDDGSGVYQVLPENVEQFNEKVNELHNEEVLENIEDYQINISQLEQSNISIKPTILFDLEWLLVE